MYFYLSKTLGFFSIPTNIILLIVISGLLLWRSRYARLGRRLTIAGIVLFLVAGMTPLGTALLLPLENRFPQWDPAQGPPDGIVVLGGGVLNSYVSRKRNDLTIGPSAERLIAAVDLQRRYPTARIVLSGGNASIFGGVPNPIWRPVSWRVLGCRSTILPSIAPRAIRWRTPSTPRKLPARNQVSAGCLSPRPSTCRGQWVCFARRASRLKPIRSIGRRGAGAISARCPGRRSAGFRVWTSRSTNG